MATAHESSSEPRVVWGMAQQLDSLFGNEDLLFELDCFVLSFLPDVSFHAEHHSAPDYAAILVVEQQCRMLVREPVTWGDVGVALRGDTSQEIADSIAHRVHRTLLRVAVRS